MSKTTISHSPDIFYSAEAPDTKMMKKDPSSLPGVLGQLLMKQERDTGSSSNPRPKTQRRTRGALSALRPSPLKKVKSYTKPKGKKWSIFGSKQQSPKKRLNSREREALIAYMNNLTGSIPRGGKKKTKHRRKNRRKTKRRKC